MGIDFSHGDAHWTYCGFHRFRRRLARTIGIDLDEMDGFKRDSLLGFPVEGKKWPSPETDPIIFLLDHSDCDGVLTTEQCALVAPRLCELVSGWPDDDCDKIQSLMLVESMDEAVRENEPLEFF